MDNDNIVEWKEVRKMKNVELISIDITDIDEEDVKLIIKNIGACVTIYRNKYENISFNKISDEFSLSVSNFDNAKTKKEMIVLNGMRKETDEEFRERVGISSEESWCLSYSKLANSSKEEAKKEMNKMIVSGFVCTPESWIKHKHEIVEKFLNISDDRK